MAGWKHIAGIQISGLLGSKLENESVVDLMYYTEAKISLLMALGSHMKNTEAIWPN